MKGGMKTAVLFSGGKDSNYALFKTLEKCDRGEVILLSLESKKGKLFHRPNLKWVPLQAKAMGIELKRISVGGKSEIKALEDSLRNLKSLNVETVVSGALASNYQRKKFGKVCKELNLNFFNPLWGLDPKKYLEDLIQGKFEVIFSSYSAMGFDESWLGRRIDEEALEELLELKKKFGVHLGGEGGEYESFVLDSPLFRKKIKILEAEKVIESKYKGQLKIKKAELI